MRAVLLAIIFVLSCVVHGNAANSPEVQQIHDEVKSALLAGNFDRIDQIIDAFHRDNARTASGSLKAQIVYEALESVSFIYGGISHEILNRAEAQTDTWIAARPHSRAARIAKAMMLTHRAWHARGTGYADSVTPDQWKAFRLYNKQAKTYLELVKTDTAKDPQWYATMLMIARGLSRSEVDFEALADEALEAYPHYLPIHWQIVRMNLPMWGGTAQTLEFWIDRIATASGSDENYARAYWVAADSFYYEVVFHDSDADWPRIKGGFDAMIRAYPTNWNLNNFARFACLAKDKEKTRELLGRLGAAIDANAWRIETMPAFCQDWSSKPNPENLPEMEEVILVEAYGRNKDGVLQGMVGPIEHPTETTALNQARFLAMVYEGVRAYRLVPNPLTGTYRRPIILYQSGVIPN